MKNKRIIKLIKYDLIEGIRKNYIKNLIGVLVICFICGISIIDCNLGGKKIGYVGYLAYIFKGTPEYIKTANSEFDLPIIWLLFHAYQLFLINTYPSNDLLGYGKNILLFSGNRAIWWFSKSIWLILNILLFYGTTYFVLAILTIVRGECYISVADIENIMEADFISINADAMIITMVILPILVTITISFFQTVLSFYANPALGYIASITLLIISVYLKYPLLIGNYSMLIRNNFYVKQGMSARNGIIVCGVMIGIIIFIGNLYLSKKDILEKG